MTPFRFYHPLKVRYGDLDPQWHVNHVCTVNFFEAARVAYVISLGLFDGKTFVDYDLILAEIRVAYLAPILLTDRIRVGVRVSHLGNKSLTFEEQIEEEETGKVLATAEVAMVAFDYRKGASKPISDAWRRAISEYEGIPPGSGTN